MSIQTGYFKKVFRFNFKARTSRGLMKDKTSWFIRLWHSSNPAVFGIGECGPLPGLSVDDRPDFETVLEQTLSAIRAAGIPSADWSFFQNLLPSGFPSISFGLETAVRDLASGGKRVVFENSFLAGKPIPINGLIWMGDMDFLMHQINEKVELGFRCLKLKVGGLDFERECDTLHYIRKKYFRENITIRLDANGAFKVDDVLYKLHELSRFEVHSIEQPIKPRQEALEELCRKSPIPVALDEELIGVEKTEEKQQLLDRIKPQFIVLKPSLHGGFSGSGQWIALAEERGIGWWMTSALESSVGLNAICQFTAGYKTQIPQGLGTGRIYENNFQSPLVVREGQIFYDTRFPWRAEELDEVQRDDA